MSDTASSSLRFPDIGDLRQRHERVATVGVHPQVAAASATDRDELAVVDARSVGQRHVHAVSFELLQLSAILRRHPTLRLHHVCRLLLRQGCEGALTETGRRDYEAWPKWATSLNERRTGPLSVMPTRVIDATPTNMRQLTPSPTSSAHATAALMGDTWLTTTTSASTAAWARSSHASRTRRPTLASDSPSGGANSASPRHACHISVGTSAKGNSS